MTTLLEDVRKGLTATPKTMQPVWFYDEKGSKLFEGITAQPEYYPTETERAILRQHADAIVRSFTPPFCIAELGAGSANKTRVILETMQRYQKAVRFTAIDVSAEAIRLAKESIEATVPGVIVDGIVARNRAGILELDWTMDARWLILFLGSSIGNLEPDEAKKWLTEITAPLRPGDVFLLGVDRQKSVSILEPAYDDAQRVTAEFNLNLLDRMNRELGANFDRADFRHKAVYNAARHRVEMHLESTRAHSVSIPGIGDIHFAAGETIHTENSYKYTEPMIHALTRAAGLHVRARYEDERGWFSVLLLERTTPETAPPSCPHATPERAAARASTCEGCRMDHQLRICNTCGFVGCAESNEGHNTAHARAAHHPVFREMTPDDDGWVWCEACQEYIE